MLNSRKLWGKVYFDRLLTATGVIIVIGLIMYWIYPVQPDITPKNLGQRQAVSTTSITPVLTPLPTVYPEPTYTPLKETTVKNGWVTYIFDDGVQISLPTGFSITELRGSRDNGYIIGTNYRSSKSAITDFYLEIGVMKDQTIDGFINLYNSVPTNHVSKSKPMQIGTFTMYRLMGIPHPGNATDYYYALETANKMILFSISDNNDNSLEVQRILFSIIEQMEFTR